MEAHGAQGPPSASQAPPPGFRCVSHAPLSGRWLTLTHRPLFSARTHPSPPPPPPPPHLPASATPPHGGGLWPQAPQHLPSSAPPLTEELHPLTEAVPCLPANATQTLDQSADGGRAGRCTGAGQPIQQVVRELHEEVGAAGGRQVAQCPDCPLANGQAWAVQLWQQAVQEAGVEGTQRGAQPGESERMLDGPT